MKLLSRLLAVIVLAFMVVFASQSCKREEPAHEPQEQIDPDDDQGDGKDDPEPEQNYTYTVVSATTWKEGDRIIIQDHVQAFDLALDPGSISTDGKTATVTCADLNPAGGYDGHYHAMFPAENWGSVEHGLYYYLYFQTSNSPCAIAFDKDRTFTFKGLCSSISFTVSNKYNCYRFQGCWEEDIEFLSFYVKHKYADGGKFELRDLGSDITVIDGDNSAKGNTVYLLNDTEFSQGYEILVGNGGVYMMKATFPSSVTLSNCKAVDLGDITSKLESYKAPIDTDPVDPYKPVMGSYTKKDVSVEEISGLCLSADKDFLWAVGDQGLLSKVSFDGVATKVWSHDADMEGVTLDPETGNLYIAIEGSQKIYQINQPGYNTYKTLFYVQDAVDGGFGNSGLEGISYYKDGMIYVGAQSGASLWLYNLDGTLVWKKRLNQVTPKIEEVGGLYYDPVTDHLWVTDSEKAKLFVFDAECTRLVASYSVSFIDNAESVCVDHTNSCVWVGSDQDSPKLYKIEFTNL